MAKKKKSLMNNPQAAVITAEQLESVWMDVCPGCKSQVSAIKHDFSLCSQLQNALYRIRQLEGRGLTSHD